MRTPNRALVLCALALGACKQPSTDQAQQPSGGSTAATAPSGSEILIGATLPLTGSVRFAECSEAAVQAPRASEAKTIDRERR